MNDLKDPIISFNSKREWDVWLGKHYSSSNAVWVRFYKKYSGKQTFTYDEALESALCYGWIDGIVNKYDDESYIQRFTPRRSKSIWSKRNVEIVTRLMNEGKMMPSGIAQVEAAKEDGRWENAYASPANIQVPKEFLSLLEKNKKAKTFFETLNKTNKYAIVWNIQTAKKIETKERRMQKYIHMLTKGEKLY